MEGKINFFENDHAGTNRPHYKGYIEIDGAVHEFACWPAKTGKGWSGRYKPKAEKVQETAATGAIVDEVKKVFPGAEIEEKIPF